MIFESAVRDKMTIRLNVQHQSSQIDKGVQEVCNPSVTGSILGRGVIYPRKLIKDIESNGHLYFTTD